MKRILLASLLLAPLSAMAQENLTSPNADSILAVDEVFSIMPNGHVVFAPGVSPKEAAHAVTRTMDSREENCGYPNTMQVYTMVLTYVDEYDPSKSWDVSFYADGSTQTKGNAFTTPAEREFRSELGEQLKCK
jgi:hypothetical protein